MNVCLALGDGLADVMGFLGLLDRRMAAVEDRVRVDVHARKGVEYLCVKQSLPFNSKEEVDAFWRDPASVIALMEVCVKIQWHPNRWATLICKELMTANYMSMYRFPSYL